MRKKCKKIWKKTGNKSEKQTKKTFEDSPALLQPLPPSRKVEILGWEPQQMLGDPKKPGWRLGMQQQHGNFQLGRGFVLDRKREKKFEVVGFFCGTWKEFFGIFLQFFGSFFGNFVGIFWEFQTNFWRFLGIFLFFGSILVSFGFFLFLGRIFGNCWGIF